jgi:hypothetical protein
VTSARIRSLIALIALVIFSHATAEGRIASAVVPHVVYGGYFVSNEFEPKAVDSFIVIKDQAAFDRVFGVAAVMFDRSHRLPANAFRDYLVIAAIHRGHANVTYRNVHIRRDGTVLRVSYSTKKQLSPLTEYACPLILSVPRDNYSAVSFIENDKPVKSLPLVAATT